MSYIKNGYQFIDGVGSHFTVDVYGDTDTIVLRSDGQRFTVNTAWIEDCQNPEAELSSHTPPVVLAQPDPEPVEYASHQIVAEPKTRRSSFKIPATA